MSFPMIAITEEDLREFHRKHFPTAPAPAALFSAMYGEPVASQHVDVDQQAPSATNDAPKTATASTAGKRKREDEEYEEEDDLGYYSDGVKRTLTDEDIAFFRRSEILKMIKAARLRIAERDDDDDEEGEVVIENSADPSLADVPGAISEDQANDSVDHSTADAVSATAGDSKHSEAPQRTTKMTTSQRKKNKKRKHKNTDQVEPYPNRDEDEGITYRRIARELDEQQAVSVELDY